MRWFLLTLLAGCSIHLSNATPDPVELEAVEQAWNEDSNLPSIAGCDASRVHVTVLYPREFERMTSYAACGANPVPPCAYAASWPEEHDVYQVVIASTTVHQRKAERHELLHWLAQCTTGWPDLGHSTPGVWGVGDTVEGRAGLLAGDE